LLVEKKDTNEERVKKADRAEKRKRKRKKNNNTVKAETGQLRRKRPALADRNINAQVKDEVVDTDLGSSDDEDDVNEAIGARNVEGIGLEACRAQYANQERPQIVQVRGRQGPQVGSALDDFINPEGRFQCRRTVIMLYFGNDKTRESCVLCV
jgi:hypothetical protein